MTLDKSLLPVADPDSRPFWEYCLKKQLRFQRCAHCDWIRSIPGPACPSCGSSEADWHQVSGLGRVYSFTEVHHSVFPGFRESAPYTVAWIELCEQPALRILSLIVESDLSQIAIDMPVELTFEDAAPDLVVPRFRLRR